MNQNEYYTLPNAMAKLGVTYKTIRYYAEHELFANDESLVRFEGKKKWVSEKFIEKVRHNLETNSSRFKDPRTKDELIGEVERLNGLYNEATKKIDALENEDPYELAENERLEVFTNEEYALFEERLKEWATLQREIQLKDESFNCPPVLVLVGRVDDRWLATWSRADAVVAHPIDPRAVVTACLDLLKSRNPISQ